MTDDEIRAIIDAFLNTVGRTQYIGARYVPTFGRLGEDTWQWDEGAAAYEPLVVVQWRGDSYTSRKAVPAGTDILDEEYWANTGNFNGQLAQVYERLRALEEPTDYQPQIDALRNDLTTETETRTSEDARIDAALEAETAARGIAEEALQNQITEEAQTRAESDADMEQEIADEIQARTDADATLTAAIAAETTARADADTEIDERLDSLAYVCSRLLMGGTVLPTYVGSFEGDEQHASCVRVGGNIYTLSPNNYDGMGTLRVWNLASNSLSRSTSILMGHANSACYDTVRSCVWIVPMNTYSAGVATDLLKLYQYNVNMTSRTEVDVPQKPYGVSFDPITNDLYMLCATNGQDWIRVYRMRADEESFTLYRTVTDLQFPSTGVFGNILWQDFAVYGGTLLACKLDGTVYVIPLAPESPTVAGTFRIGFTDSGNLWRYGEVEGLEFDADGRLYSMRTCNCAFTNTGEHVTRQVGFVTELNTLTQAQTNDDCTLQTYGTLTLVPESQFALNRFECHSMNELIWRDDQTWHTVTVPEGMTLSVKKWRIMRTCELQVLGTLNISHELEVDSGDFFLYVYNGTVNFTGDGPMIDGATHPCNVKFRSRNGHVNMTNDVDLVNVGFTPSLIMVLGTDNIVSYKINEVERSGSGLYSGRWQIWAES